MAELFQKFSKVLVKISSKIEAVFFFQKIIKFNKTKQQTLSNESRKLVQTSKQNARKTIIATILYLSIYTIVFHNIRYNKIKTKTKQNKTNKIGILNKAKQS